MALVSTMGKVHSRSGVTLGESLFLPSGMWGIFVLSIMTIRSSALL